MIQSSQTPEKVPLWVEQKFYTKLTHVCPPAILKIAVERLPCWAMRHLSHKAIKAHQNACES